MKTKKNILVTYKLMSVAYFSLATSIKMVSKISVGQKVLHLLSISYLLDFDLQHASLLIMCPEIYEHINKNCYCVLQSIRPQNDWKISLSSCVSGQITFLPRNLTFQCSVLLL